MVCGLVQLPVVTVLSAVEAGLEPAGYYDLVQRDHPLRTTWTETIV